jgi:phosphoglucomutase
MGLFTVTKKATTPFEGQKPGTSGLRKKVSLHPPVHVPSTPIRISV